MSEYKLKAPKEAKAVVGAEKKIEGAVVGAYKKIKDTVEQDGGTQPGEGT